MLTAVEGFYDALRVNVLVSNKKEPAATQAPIRLTVCYYILFG